MCYVCVCGCGEGGRLGLGLLNYCGVVNLKGSFMVRFGVFWSLSLVIDVFVVFLVVGIGCLVFI